MVRIRAAIAAGASLTGKRFGLLGRLLAGRDLGDRRRGGDQPAGSQPARLDPRPQPRRRPHPGRGAAPSPNPNPKKRRRKRSSTNRPRRRNRPSSRRSNRNRSSSLKKRRPNRSKNRRRNPNRRRTRRPTPVESKPEAGRIKHVFLVSLLSSGYQAAFGTTGSHDALPERDAPSQGPAADQLLGAGRSDHAERGRDDQRPAAEQGDQGRLPDLQRLPVDLEDQQGRDRLRRRLRLRGGNADPGRPAGNRPDSPGRAISKGW